MITNKEIVDYIEANIGSFHDARLKSLQSLKIEKQVYYIFPRIRGNKKMRLGFLLFVKYNLLTT
jgi:hypothetical protein